MLKLSDSTALIEAAEARHNLSLELGPKASLSDISKLSFSPFLGVSIGNRTFFRRSGDTSDCVEYIRDCLAFGLEFSRDDKVLAVIGDKLHAINLQYADNYNPQRAENVAGRMGDEVENIVVEAARGLPSNLQERVIISRWQPLVEMKSGYSGKLEQIREAYATNSQFEQAVDHIVDEMTRKRTKPIDEVNKKHLSEYILQELALLAGGVEYFDERGRTLFDLLMYPSMGNMQELVDATHEPVNTPDWQVRAQDLDTDWVSASISLSRPVVQPLVNESQRADLAGVQS